MDYRSTRIFNLYCRLLRGLNINPEKMNEFMKFAMVGGSGVLVNMGCFFVFTRYAGIRIEIASPMAIEISILTNFLLNNTWTFRRRDTRTGFWGRILRYHLVTAVAGIVNYFTLLLLTHVAGLHDLVSNLIGIILGTFINFFLNSMWTWRITDPERKPESEIAPGAEPSSES